jgi:hypothetical protein
VACGTGHETADTGLRGPDRGGEKQHKLKPMPSKALWEFEGNDRECNMQADPLSLVNGRELLCVRGQNPEQPLFNVSHHVVRLSPPTAPEQQSSAPQTVRQLMLNHRERIIVGDSLTDVHQCAYSPRWSVVREALHGESESKQRGRWGFRQGSERIGYCSAAGNCSGE